MLICRLSGAFEHFQNWGSAGKRGSLSSTSKLQLRKGFKVSRKQCLNLCSFKWLQRGRNLVRYLTPTGSLILNIDLLLGLIKKVCFWKLQLTPSFIFLAQVATIQRENLERKNIWNNQFCNCKTVPVSSMCHKSFH